jgi:hypothetical protein
MDSHEGGQVTSTAARALIAVVNGDVTAVYDVYRHEHDELRSAAEDLHLVLTASALARVLEEFDDGMHTADAVHRWAEFVRCGFFGPIPPGGIFPVDIDYELQAEDDIVEAMARLNELGDIIDGELRPGEAAELRKALLAHASTRS